ncbi:MAG: L-serine ammonia-lyase [Candidatus Bruticola sp.]
MSDIPILTTLEELYKFGPGPSSSHTMGPMLAGYNFYRHMSHQSDELLQKADHLDIILLGSLSATGKGHGTDKAVLAGVLGHQPEDCSPDLLDELSEHRQRKYSLQIGSFTTTLAVDDIIYGPTIGDFAHPNTMQIRVCTKDRQIILEREYYSVGGGFIEWKGRIPEKKPMPPYPYTTFKELKSYVDENHSLFDILLANEMALTGKTEKEVIDFAARVVKVMQNSACRGMHKTGSLPGPLGLQSKARRLLDKFKNRLEFSAEMAITAVAAVAIAVSEENARGHVICTAPTAGSAGVMAGAVQVLLNRNAHDVRRVCESLIVAAAIGYLCKRNATISGAEGGCQAEVGVASAMTAALLVNYRGGTAEIIENAAESALEQHLGLTCDPVGGYVQIPCIERNGFGIIKAWTASSIALDEVASSHMVDLDSCIEAMNLTAKEMSSKYKETAEGGLAKVLC